MENINDYLPLSNDWNKERLEKLKELMPDLFTNEGKLNTNEFKKLVDSDSISETERYEFRWFGKSNAKREAFTPTDATLVYDEARSVNPTESENLIIEGENLNVLKLLSNSYREKVKCIYIDPPYNTGTDSFGYNDNFNHSAWLTFMKNRLEAAKELLCDYGSLYVQLDYNGK
ncbi:hypothetical protein ES705_47476 [subsurface metagenome]